MTTEPSPSIKSKPPQIPAMDLRRFFAFIVIAFGLGLVVGFRLPRAGASGAESAQSSALFTRLLKETQELKELQLETQMRMLDCPQGILPERKPKAPIQAPPPQRAPGSKP